VSSASYKHALDDASVVYSEQLVGEHSSNSMKIDTNLFFLGQQKMYDDCLAAVTNLHACLTFMLKEGTLSYVIKHLKVLFITLADYKFESWFNYHASNDVTWLYHSVLIDVHNYFCTMVSMAMHPDNQSKALKNQTNHSLCSHLRRAIGTCAHDYEMGFGHKSKFIVVLQFRTKHICSLQTKGNI
jgi:hypothetical protein